MRKDCRMNEKLVYIYGVGAGYQIVQKCILLNNINIVGLIDANAEKFANGINEVPVIKLDEFDLSTNYDYIVVTLMNYESVVQALLNYGIEDEKIIRFFSIEDACKDEYWNIIERNTWRMEVLTYLYNFEVRPMISNMKYEVADEIRKQEIEIPKVLSIEETIETICKQHKSICRFGDGEFELIQMHKRAKFQSVNRELALRLKGILKEDNGELLIAIADNYGSLIEYTDRAQKDIRNYLTPEVRRNHYSLLSMNKVYYNAYFTRPYIIYHDKKKADYRFEQIKQIWNQKDVLVVEGDKTRMGVGNDLFSNVKSIERVLAPSEDAFSSYNEILVKAKRYGKNKLILIALGPTATVLAYDLAKEGYWAIDIGHIDLEYEWFKRKALDKCIIEYKYVNEVARGNDVFDGGEFVKYKEEYEKQILDRIV